MTEIEIRPLRPGDEPGLARFREAIPDGERRFFKQDPGSLDQFPLSWGRWLVAVDGAEIVGLAAALPGTGWSSHVSELRILVAPSHRGRGLGRELARRALREALELGCTRALLVTDPGLEKAGHPQRARSGQGQGCAVPPGQHIRGLWRSRGPPAT